MIFSQTLPLSSLLPIVPNLKNVKQAHSTFSSQCDFGGAAWFDCTQVPFISSLLIPHCTRAIKGAPLTLISHPASGATSSAALFLFSLWKWPRTKVHPVLVQYLPCSLARGDRKRNLRRRRCRCIGRGRPHCNANRNRSVGYSVTLSMISSTSSCVSICKLLHVAGL